MSQGIRAIIAAHITVVPTLLTIPGPLIADFSIYAHFLLILPDFMK